jgi:hypothetical protein
MQQGIIDVYVYETVNTEHFLILHKRARFEEPKNMINAANCATNYLTKIMPSDAILNLSSMQRYVDFSKALSLSQYMSCKKSIVLI